MKRMAFVCALFAAMVISVMAVAPDSQGPKTAPRSVSGELDGRFAFVPYDTGFWDFLTTGQATGTLKHLGWAKLYTTHQPHADGTLTGGEFKIVAASGEEMHGTYEGSAASVSADQTVGEATLVVSGGTGGFTNASGTITGTFLETFDDSTWASAKVRWTLDGTVSYPKVAGTETIVFVSFADPTAFTIGGGGAAFWGRAPLSGTPFLPSQFVQGGSQAGTIFYGSFAKESASSPAATMTIGLPDLSEYKNLRLTVALAAPPGIWEPSHRDSLRIIGGTALSPVPVVDCSLANGCLPVPGTIDTFLPPAYPASLRSQVYSIDLGRQFKDFEYPIDSRLRLLTFAFASTDYPELVGIDSVTVTGDRVR